MGWEWRGRIGDTCRIWRGDGEEAGWERTGDKYAMEMDGGSGVTGTESRDG